MFPGLEWAFPAFGVIAFTGATFALMLPGARPRGLLTVPPTLALILAVWVPRCFPDAVRSLPPLAVAPFPPMLVILPALLRVRRLWPPLVLAALRAGLPLPPPPPDANRPRLSRLYVLAMTAALL